MCTPRASGRGKTGGTTTGGQRLHHLQHSNTYTTAGKAMPAPQVMLLPPQAQQQLRRCRLGNTRETCGKAIDNWQAAHHGHPGLRERAATSRKHEVLTLALRVAGGAMVAVVALQHERGRSGALGEGRRSALLATGCAGKHHACAQGGCGGPAAGAVLRSAPATQLEGEHSQCPCHVRTAGPGMLCGDALPCRAAAVHQS